MSSVEEAVSKLRGYLPGADRRIFLFFEAWLKARDGAAVPFRRDFHPDSIPSLLGFIWLYRYDSSKEDFVVQLAGESINDAWGRGIKGLTLRDIVGDADYPVVRERWLGIVNRPAVQYGAAQEQLSAIEAWNAERLQMPMRSDDGAIDVVIGVSLYKLELTTSKRTAVIPEDVIQFPCEDFL